MSTRKEDKSRMQSVALISLTAITDPRQPLTHRKAGKNVGNIQAPVLPTGASVERKSPAEPDSVKRSIITEIQTGKTTGTSL